MARLQKALMTDPASPMSLWGAGDLGGGDHQADTHLTLAPVSQTCHTHTHTSTMWEKSAEQETQSRCRCWGEQQMASTSFRTRMHSQDSTVLLQILNGVGSKRDGLTERNEVNQPASSLTPRLFIAAVMLGGAGPGLLGWFSAGNSGRAQAAVTFLHL